MQVLATTIYIILNYTIMKALTTTIIAFVALTISAQQSSILPHNYSDQFVYNPAATSLWGGTDVSGYYNQAFSNVSNAPTVLFAGMQYGLPGQSAAVGGYLLSESASLLSQNTLAGTFSYKLRGIGDGYLSLGMGATLSMYNFNGNDALVIDQADPNLGGQESGMGINFQSGLVYSSAEQQSGRNAAPVIWQAGIGAARLNKGINIRQLYEYEQEMLLSAFASTIVDTGSDIVIKGYVQAQYEALRDMYVVAGGRTLISDSFLAGASVDTELNVGLQFGVLLKPRGGNSTSTLAANFNLPFGPVATIANPGVGITFQHQIDEASGW